MATMVPVAIPDASEADQVVFNLLRDDPVTDGWVILHGVNQRPSDRRQGAIDFLALIPDAAILCVEVKGGGFEVKSGQWYALNTRQPVDPPGKRAEKAMYALDGQLRARISHWNGDFALPMDSVVLFTDTTWPPHLRPLAYPTVGLPDLEVGANQTLGQRLNQIAAEIRDDLPDSPALDPTTVRAIQDCLTVPAV